MYPRIHSVVRAFCTDALVQIAHAQVLNQHMRVTAAFHLGSDRAPVPVCAMRGRVYQLAACTYAARPQLFLFTAAQVTPQGACAPLTYTSVRAQAPQPHFTMSCKDALAAQTAKCGVGALTIPSPEGM